MHRSLAFPFVLALLVVTAPICVRAQDAARTVPDEGGGQPSLLESLAAALNATDAQALRAACKSEVPSVQALLAPLLATLPRGEAGHFEAPAVRYALHRHFVRQYGWHLKGLDPAGGSWDSASPAQAAALLRLPAAARRALEARLAPGTGLDADEVAVLAVVLELLVHGESVERLRAAYAVRGLRPGRPVPEATAVQTMDLYMAGFLLGRSLQGTPPGEAEQLLSGMTEVYPPWPRLQGFVKDALAGQRRAELRGASVDFATLARAAGQVGRGFGPWQNTECASLKRSLVELEDQGTGRVRLADFYHAGLNGNWQFQESADYLRKLGALDESNPSNLRVIIPNWLSGPSNCVGTSDLHDVCCISECETLMGHVEQGLAAPAGTPEQVAAVVSGVGSSSVPAGRDLGPVLLHRLQAIAHEQDGLVPIYGRLFAQWMHHAYPRECPYPHLADTTRPQNVFEWEEATAKDAVATEAEMREHVGRKSKRKEAPVERAPWVNKEDQLFAHPNLAPPHPVAWLAVHCAALAAMLVTFSLGLLKTALRVARRLRGTGPSPDKRPRASQEAPPMLI